MLFGVTVAIIESIEAYENLATGEISSFAFPSLALGETLYGLEYLYDDVFALSIDDENGTAVCTLFDTQIGAPTGVRYSQTKKSQYALVARFGDQLIHRMYETPMRLRNQGDAGLVNEMCYFTVFLFISKDSFWQGAEGTEIILPTA